MPDTPECPIAVIERLPTAYTLSVVMPAHNEARTIGKAVRAVLDLDLGHRHELIVVDDGSTDGTSDVMAKFCDERLIVHRHPTNLGKGAAVLTGAALATGTHVVVFDADQEYLASDLARMFEPITLGYTKIVFGTRIFGMNTVYQSYRYAMGNRMTTLAANLMFDSCLTDLHTCLKMLPLPLFRELELSHSGFGLDSEITAELLRRGHRPFEVPVSYLARSHAEGKKITWRDGVECLLVLGRVRLRPSLNRAPVPAVVVNTDRDVLTLLDDEVIEIEVLQVDTAGAPLGACTGLQATGLQAPASS